MTDLIEVKGIAKAFGGIKALNGCSFTVQKGDIHGLIGPNGSGKTTLFNVMTGYERPDAGSVNFNGKEITGQSPGKIFRMGIGRTFQLTRVFSRLSVLDNMLIAAQHQHKWFKSALRSPGQGGERQRALDLLDFVGIARLAELEAGSLSYGQRKLLELAYLLMADPDVLFLDEPAGGVNPTLINQLTERIRELNAAGKTILVVEHNMEFVMGLCDRITVMHQGVALLTDLPATVRSDPRVLDAYLGGVEEEAEGGDPDSMADATFTQADRSES
ncbi:MAG: ABC transporter ATP-binding protein [Acidimicrobiaceae bacterium]|nr:ABC transporter ATP-binding protein [Acidimicrobiaceae bacterium]